VRLRASSMGVTSIVSGYRRIFEIHQYFKGDLRREGRADRCVFVAGGARWGGPSGTLAGTETPPVAENQVAYIAGWLSHIRDGTAADVVRAAN